MTGRRVVGRTFAAYGRTQSVSVNAANSGYVCVSCGRPLPNARNLTICYGCQRVHPAPRKKRQQPASRIGKAIASNRRETKIEERLRRQAR